MEALPSGPLMDRTAHLCVDMQNLFAEETPWHTPWMARVLPVVTRMTHDALLTLCCNRFSQQIETASSETILACWD